MYWRALLLACVLAPASLQAQSGGLSSLFGSSDEFLPVAEAFALSVSREADDRIVAQWDIAKDYYLYRDKIGVEIVGDGTVARLESPPGEVIVDEYFGRMEVYRDQVAVSAYLSEPVDGPVEVRVAFQGCADAGLCYPPESVTIALAAAGSGGGTPVATPAGGGDGGGGNALGAGVGELSSLLAGGQPLLIITAFFAAGLLLAFTACLYPMIPILSGLIAGDPNRGQGARSFLLSLVYVESTAVTYASAGIAAGLSGAAVQASFQSPWVLGTFAALFVALALSMFGLYELRLPTNWQTRVASLSGRQRGGSFIGVAIMGVLSTLIVGACSGPALVAALAFIANTGDAVLGGLALFALANGMGLPLLVIGTAAGKWLPQAGAWMQATRGVFGVLFLAVALWMLERFLPGALVLVLWGALLLGAGVFLGGLDRLPSAARGLPRLRKATGLLLVVWGIAAVIGAASGGRDVLRPLHTLTAQGPGSTSGETLAVGRFQPVTTTEELDGALREASAQGRPVLLDVYADWCVYCVQLDEHTFSHPGVSRLLADAVLLRADVTANNVGDKALLNRLEVFLPPAVIFYDRSGREVRSERVVGFLGPEDFAKRARTALYGETG